MSKFYQKITLGKTGRKVGRLGIAANFGAPASSIEEAFEKGCNYFLWGSVLKGRSKEMRTVINNITKNGKREDLFLSMILFGHTPYLNKKSLLNGLKSIQADYADCAILGLYNKPPSTKIMEGMIKLKEEGLIKHIGLSTHNRKLVPILAKEGIIDIFHVRYNAVHRGAEQDIFPYLNSDINPGIVAFTATSHRQLLNPKKIPAKEKVPDATECYRFVLTNQGVDVCMAGPKNEGHMKENLRTLETRPMTEDELNRMRKIGDHIYSK